MRRLLSLPVYTYVRAGVAVLLSGVAAFLGLCLWTFNVSDRSAFYFSTAGHAVANKGGMCGSYVSAFLLYMFGSAAFLWIPFLLFAAYLLIAKQSMRAQWERLGAFVGFIVLSATVLHLSQYDVLNIFPGGYIGMRMTQLLLSKLDPFTVHVFVSSMLLVSLILCLQFSFVGYVHYALCAVQFLLSRRFLQPVYTVCYKAVRLISLPAIRLCRLVHRLFQASTVHNEDHSILEFERGIRQTQLKDDAFWQSYVEPNLEQDLQEDALQEQTFAGSTIDIPQAGEDAFVEFYDDELFEDTLPGDAFREDTLREDALLEDVFEDEEDADVHGVRYALPGLHIFVGNDEEKDDPKIMQHLQEHAQILEDKLKRFGVNGSVVSIKRGPVVTMFEYQPDIDSKISKIIALEDDLALALQALSIRIIAPIPGKAFVGFEVSNRHRKEVLFANVIKSQTFADFKGSIPLVLGHDTVGNDVVVDLVRMPHLLVAGSTGSGKSVALNAMLVSMLCRMSPDELRLVLIDPKRLEFASYADIAHLLFPIVTQPKKAAPVLKWVVQQMEERYEMMAAEGGRNIQDYNLIMEKQGRDKLPYIVVVIDELADLMMTAGRDIEDLIARITQMARAAGIHLIVATQRPSVDVITGLIKVNFPSRISFRVTSKIDSRTILDCGGADKLLGRGDMLFLDPQGAGLRRLHGAYVSDQEIEHVVQHIKQQRQPDYLDLDAQLDGCNTDEDKDDIYIEVLNYLAEIDEVSISLLQRKFKIGYNRSARIIDMLEAEGCIAPSGNGKTRTVIR